MVKHTHPEFHRAFMENGFFPEADGHTKFHETRHAFLYRSGNSIYKIRKEPGSPGSLPVREAYTHQVQALGKQWAPEVFQQVLRLVRTHEGFALGGEGEVVTFVQKLTHLTGGHWMDKLIERKKLNQTALGRLARFLADRHAAPPAKIPPPKMGRPEFLRELFEDVFYQAKKYIGITVAPPLVDLVERPVYRFIEDSGKLLRRREKKGRIVTCHGAVTPEHIYFRGRDILIVSPFYGSPKFSLIDAASDLAILLNEMELLGAGEHQDLILKRYTSQSKDRDIAKLLPIFRIFQAMHMGQLLSEKLSAVDPASPEKAELHARAHQYFNLAARIAPEISHQ